MAKGLPYFKFIVMDWITGDIVLEEFEVQGLFINICSIYWQRDGNLSKEDLIKRFKKPDALESLIPRFIKIECSGKISIDFLDEQLSERNYKSSVNSENGKKGGRPKVSETLEIKPNALPIESEIKAIRIKEEEKENKKERKEDRKNDFINKVFSLALSDNNVLVNDFLGYWTESSSEASKMRFELQKVFDIQRRFSTWIKNDKKFNNGKQSITSKVSEF